MSSSNCNVLNRELSSSSTSHTRFSFEGEVTSPEQLHYSLGKTIGSGTYAKVKASWSPYERKMVSPTPFRATAHARLYYNTYLPCLVFLHELDLNVLDISCNLLLLCIVTLFMLCSPLSFIFVALHDFFLCFPLDCHQDNGETRCFKGSPHQVSTTRTGRCPAPPPPQHPPSVSTGRHSSTGLLHDGDGSEW